MQMTCFVNHCYRHFENRTPPRVLSELLDKFINNADLMEALNASYGYFVS